MSDPTDDLPNGYEGRTVKRIEWPVGHDCGKARIEFEDGTVLVVRAEGGTDLIWRTS